MDTNRIVRRPEVLHLIGLGRTQLEAAIDRGEFPKPIKITDGGRAVGWMSREVEGFIASRVAKRDQPQAA
jgi:prophage regulatory protein